MHHILQRLGIRPGILYKLPRGEKAFIFASMRVQLEQEAKERQAARNQK